MVTHKSLPNRGRSGVGSGIRWFMSGGTISNLFSVLLDAYFVLSITMTFFSTIFALVMMPLNLLIYASSFTSAGEKIQTPFVDILIQLALLSAPVGIGIFLGWCCPKARRVAEKYVKPVSALVVVGLVSTDLPLNYFVFFSPWQYYCAAMLFPFIGSLLGYLISKLTRLSTRKAIAVSVETGVQNALLAFSVLTFSYPQPEADLAIRMPFLIVLFTSFEGLLVVLVYIVLKKYYWHGIPFRYEKIERESGKIKKNENTEADEEKEQTACI